MPAGTRIVIVRGHYFVGSAGVVVCDYRSPFGPSVLVRLDDGREMACKIADLDVA